MSLDMDKKLAEITVRVTLETKDVLVRLADKRGLDGVSELIRNAIADLLAKERAEYEALRFIFSDDQHD